MYGGVGDISIGDKRLCQLRTQALPHADGPGYEAMLSVDLWHTYCPRVHVNVYRGDLL